MHQLWNEGIAAFKERHPGVEVEVIQISANTYRDWIITNYVAGTLPDVILTSLRERTPYSFIEAGVLLSLNDYIERSGFDIDDFFAPVIQSWTFDGKIVAIPRSNASRTIFYNEDLFNAAGIVTPGEQARQGTWNFEAWFESAQKLTVDRSGDGVPEQAGSTKVTISSLPISLNFLYMNDARLFSPDFQRVTIGEPNAIEALQWLVDFNRAVVPQSSIGSFAGGQYAMTYDWMDRFASFGPGGTRELPFNWDLAPYPANKSDVQHFEHGPGYAITHSSEHPDLAWELIIAFTERETQMKWVEGGFEPVRASVARSHSWLRHPSGVKNLDIAYNERVIKSEGYPFHKGVEEVLAVITPALSRINAGDVDPKTAIEEILQSAQTALLEAQK